jgi:DNA-binding NtrC family response regulator
MQANKRTVLVVDDEPGHRQMVRAVLEDTGWRVLEADSGEAALDVLSRETPHTALVDMRMPGMDGLTLLREIHARMPGLPVVLLTAFGSVGSAVEAMKKGAYDYLTKPADNEELKAVLQKCWEYSRLLSENARLRKEAEAGSEARQLIGATPGMHQVRELIEQAGPSEASVLVLGESGTGKELVAEGLHRASMRAGRSLIKVNCAALPADLLESELFGYEIGEMPAALQAKLLRALQEKTIEPLGGVEVVTVDVRIIAATNRDLQEEIRAGRFREDLYYRLAVLEIRIPPLRERVADLPLLVSHLLRKLGKKNNKSVRTVSPAFLDALSGYGWPGNVRELENVLERALILSRSDELGPDLLPPQISGASECEPASPQPPDNSHALEDAEREAIVHALDQHNGHRERTADALGISRRTLQYKLKKYGLTRR